MSRYLREILFGEQSDHVGVTHFLQVFHDQDLRPDSSLTPPTERPPPPPASSSSSSTTPAVTPTSVKRDSVLKKLPSSDQEEIDRQERAIIEGLELEEREHKKYMDTIQSMRGN